MRKKSFYNATLTRQSAHSILKTLYGFTDEQADKYLNKLKGKYTVINIMYADLKEEELKWEENTVNTREKKQLA